VGSDDFFREVEEHRYSLEPHIPEIVGFPRWSGCEVIEVGCGLGTDGARFARAGASYTGVDASPEAIELARRRFDREGLQGSFVAGSATKLPFDAESADLLYSHGVLHHIDDTQGAVDEIHRVLRPGGTALVMLYHRDSLNYRLNIMLIRRLLALALLVPGVERTAARVAGEDPELLRAHRELLRRHGSRYLTDTQLFLSNNTDGPHNPLSKVYSRGEAIDLFSSFDGARTAVRYLNLRLFPGGDRIAASRAGRSLERRLGWHLYVSARK
jgi:ubiquinone/menaquinone biosynthesis C-methylase UbiE